VHEGLSAFLHDGVVGTAGSPVSLTPHAEPTEHVAGTSTGAAAEDGNPMHLPVFPCEKSALMALFRAHTSGNKERAFAINDVGIVERQFKRWCRQLPRVKPFYAVKCNPDMVLLRTLADMGANFDCASGEEMRAVLTLGVTPDRIIFANPIKNVKDLRFARKVGVTKMTFDNEAELYKVREHHPEAEMVLRVLADDSGSVMKFGVKFGAPQPHHEHLLSLAKKLDVKVIGTSFHIGSGCFDATSYEKAIALSRSVFDLAEKLGLPKMTFLDLGGGFPGAVEGEQPADNVPVFESFTAVIRESLDKHFPAGCSVDIIAEPGRYMATAWSTLFTLVQGKREEPVAADAAQRKFLYYINDGVYGSFNCMMFDHASPVPVPAYRFMHDKVAIAEREQLYAANAAARSNPALLTNGVAPLNGLVGAGGAGATMSAAALHKPHMDANRPSLSSRSFSNHRNYRSFSNSNHGREPSCVATIFGPTCDSMDVIAKNLPLEELFVGDWLAIPNFGAYTAAASTTFNGMPKPITIYCRSKRPSPTA